MISHLLCQKKAVGPRPRIMVIDLRDVINRLPCKWFITKMYGMAYGSFFYFYVIFAH